ncbi:MAG: hypothetical protein KGR16_02475 [Verrucomicrobia bacterium]|nr:hypothetical protein [Verrucomicrobiota bacterium]MDE3047626.1 hypothetical protein [Verrucomicrobiota bacterium]
MESKGSAHTAYILLKIVFVAAPIIAGVDKFFDLLVDWDQYLGVSLGGFTKTFMMVVGIVEILVGLGVIWRPRLFANIAGIWLALIVVNLLILSNFYDVALRDVGLCLSAFALGQLAKVYGR